MRFDRKGHLPRIETEVSSEKGSDHSHRNERPQPILLKPEAMGPFDIPGREPIEQVLDPAPEILNARQPDMDLIRGERLGALDGRRQALHRSVLEGQRGVTEPRGGAHAKDCVSRRFARQGPSARVERARESRHLSGGDPGHPFVRNLWTPPGGGGIFSRFGP